MNLINCGMIITTCIRGDKAVLGWSPISTFAQKSSLSLQKSNGSSPRVKPRVMYTPSCSVSLVIKHFGIKENIFGMLLDDTLVSAKDFARVKAHKPFTCMCGGKIAKLLLYGKTLNFPTANVHLAIFERLSSYVRGIKTCSPCTLHETDRVRQYKILPTFQVQMNLISIITFQCELGSYDSLLSREHESHKGQCRTDENKMRKVSGFLM